MTEAENTLIDRYLSGEMPVEERAAFSRRLETDEALADRVELRRELMSYVKDDESGIRELLAEADQEYYAQAESAGSHSTKWWVLLVVLILAGLVVWWMTNKPVAEKEEDTSTIEVPVTPVERPEDDTLNTVPMPEADREPEQETPADTEDAAPDPGPAEQDVPTQPDDEIPTERPVYAQLDLSDFRPNPILEDLIGGELRSGPEDSTSVVLFPVRDTLLLAEMMTAELRGFSTVAPPYEVLIFDNQEQSFLEDKPVIRKTLEGEAQASGNLFKLELGEVSAPGRFYVLVLDRNGEILSGDWFLVR